MINPSRYASSRAERLERNRQNAFQVYTGRQLEDGSYEKAFLCYVTPAEHLALPNVDDVKQGIVASKIAAHAADIAKGIPHARDIDDKMGDARRVLDWDAQFACALDPETAKAIRDARLPEDDHSDTCSMCGKFCAVRSMNKALAGEYIDIL